MNQQREVIYTLRRRDMMVEEDLEPVLSEFRNDILDDAYTPLEQADTDTAIELRKALQARLATSSTWAAYWRPMPPCPTVLAVRMHPPDLPAAARRSRPPVPGHPALLPAGRTGPHLEGTSAQHGRPA